MYRPYPQSYLDYRREVQRESRRAERRANVNAALLLAGTISVYVAGLVIWAFEIHW